MSLIVFFDGSCPLCSKEIEVYRKKDLLGRLRFDDITDPHFKPEAFHLDPVFVRKHLHALNPGTGKLFTGLDSFIEIWKLIPELKWLARVATLPLINPTLKLLYSIFAVIRPYLPKKSVCPPEGCDL